MAILVVRTRKRQVRRVEKEMEMTQRCHFCMFFLLRALLVACQGFSMYTKNREPPVSPKHVTIVVPT